MDPTSASVTKTCFSRAVLSKGICINQFQYQKSSKLANRTKMAQFVNRTKRMPSQVISPKEYLRYQPIELIKCNRLILYLN